MLKIMGSEDYYPTPEELLDGILSTVDWESIKYVLEPSAGKGNIVEYLPQAARKYRRESHYYRDESLDIDCIEIEPELRAILKDKGFRVVHDDFLTLHTYKHYDLIIMNPPFSAGARHLLKAISVQETSGGQIICILNAETIRNAYTSERKDLAQKLENYGAEIKYYEKAFSVSENPTDVEVAVVNMVVPSPTRKTTIFETLREKEYEEYERKRETSELAEMDFVKSFVALYNRELEWGLRLYDEYLELKSKALDENGLLMLEIGSHSSNAERFTVNGYVRAIRRKYWEKLFEHPSFTGRLTSNLYYKYTSHVSDFTNYDFSYWNIKTVQQEIALSLVKGVEQSIIELFDELSAKHSWDEDLPGNIHYYNGWKTNLSWKINRRVILPLQAFDDNRFIHTNRQYAIRKLSDIEKALDYLDYGETGEANIDIEEYLESGITRNIPLKYFTVTFYKKGTCHITFTNERLLKKLNIFGSQRKGWLPKGYARKRYEELNAEEQAVIDSFEGREAYNDTVMESQYYLFDAGRSMPMLTSGE